MATQDATQEQSIGIGGSETTPVSSNRTPSRPGVGIASIVVNGKNEILVGERMGSHGANTIAFPGGHIEYEEDWSTCSKREVLEETGLDTRYMGFVAVTNDVFVKDQKHYVTIFSVNVLVDPAKDEPKLLEPDKCKEWKWVKWAWLREDDRVLFVPVENLLKDYLDIEKRVEDALKSEGDCTVSMCSVVDEDKTTSVGK